LSQLNKELQEVPEVLQIANCAIKTRDKTEVKLKARVLTMVNMTNLRDIAAEDKEMVVIVVTMVTNI
jgi:hypothetical protein